jgi:hypothetical protein
LKKFSLVEEEISIIPNAKLIGAMELKTENLSEGLKGWAKEWK